MNTTDKCLNAIFTVLEKEGIKPRLDHTAEKLKMMVKDYVVGHFEDKYEMNGAIKPKISQRIASTKTSGIAQPKKLTARQRADIELWERLGNTWDDCIQRLKDEKNGV